ncbi:hypothetical protein RJT34_11207 [Clitoria ternatea]|uniref:Uncharacterized protein n=1 Tax=Clitoria ternatea TaxID=43366 RepID=A0AAN9PJD3_CLITE
MSVKDKGSHWDLGYPVLPFPSDHISIFFRLTNENIFRLMKKISLSNPKTKIHLLCTSKGEIIDAGGCIGVVIEGEGFNGVSVKALMDYVVEGIVAEEFVVVIGEDFVILVENVDRNVDMHIVRVVLERVELVEMNRSIVSEVHVVVDNKVGVFGVVRINK